MNATRSADNLVPDYMTKVREGAFYGWPYSYFGQHVDERVQPQNRELVQRRSDRITRSARTPLRSDSPSSATPTFGAVPNGAIIGQHGSWNRSPRVGYRVIFVKFENGAPVGARKRC